MSGFQGSGFRVSGFQGFRFQGLGFRVFRLRVLGSRVQGTSRFWVKGSKGAQGLGPVSCRLPTCPQEPAKR